MLQKNKRSSYKRITENVRREIIRRFQEGEALKEISKDVSLNVSTCKGIIKVYQEEGRIGKKLKRNRPVRIIQTFSYFEINKEQKKRLSEPLIQEKELLIEENEKNDEQLLIQSKKRVDQHLIKISENEKNLIQPKFNEQENFANMLQWQNYSNYHTFYGCAPGINWFMPIPWQ